MSERFKEGQLEASIWKSPIGETHEVRDWSVDEALCLEATPGPKQVFRAEHSGYCYVEPDPVDSGPRVASTGNGSRSLEDARLFAQARDGWLAALLERRRLAAEVKHCRSTIERLQSENAQLAAGIRKLQGVSWPKVHDHPNED